jgi:hypothetical protein
LNCYCQLWRSISFLFHLLQLFLPLLLLCIENYFSTLV